MYRNTIGKSIFNSFNYINYSNSSKYLNLVDELDNTCPKTFI